MYFDSGYIFLSIFNSTISIFMCSQSLHLSWKRHHNIQRIGKTRDFFSVLHICPPGVVWVAFDQMKSSNRARGTYFFIQKQTSKQAIKKHTIELEELMHHISLHWLSKVQERDSQIWLPHNGILTQWGKSRASLIAYCGDIGKLRIFSPKNTLLPFYQMQQLMSTESPSTLFNKRGFTNHFVFYRRSSSHMRF